MVTFSLTPHFKSYVCLVFNACARCAYCRFVPTEFAIISKHLNENFKFMSRWTARWLDSEKACRLQMPRGVVWPFRIDCAPPVCLPVLVHSQFCFVFVRRNELWFLPLDFMRRRTHATSVQCTCCGSGEGRGRFFHVTIANRAAVVVRRTQNMRAHTHTLERRESWTCFEGRCWWTWMRPCRTVKLDDIRNQFECVQRG